MSLYGLHLVIVSPVYFSCIQNYIAKDHIYPDR